MSSSRSSEPEKEIESQTSSFSFFKKSPAASKPAATEYKWECAGMSSLHTGSADFEFKRHHALLDRYQSCLFREATLANIYRGHLRTQTFGMLVSEAEYKKQMNKCEAIREEVDKSYSKICKFNQT